LDIISELNRYEFNGAPWIAGLEQTEQSPLYHGEGNVWIHTQSVIENMLADQSFITLPARDQKVLIIAAALHDIAKPFCTKIIDGEIISPHHAQKGETEARRLIYKQNLFEEIFGSLSFCEREEICSLIRYHGLPILFLEKEDPKRELLRAACEVNARHLAMLAAADVNGRVCPDKQTLLENIELFLDACAEYGCLDGARVFPSDTSRLMYFKYGEQYSHYPQQDYTGSHVYLMCGLPAAGKDTYIKNNLSGLPVISLDALRMEMGVKPSGNQGAVIQQARNTARRLLAQKQDFIWNATNISLRIRSGLIDLFLGYKARISIIYVEAPYSAVLARNARRGKPVPENFINKLADNLEIPKMWEAQMVVYCAEQI